ncbi:hypothetical protein FB451DRAFT_1164882 [Mycena latifolia]|nr:hypothetical protein FB451DRAFT_1164882 [Mycena latifolia]
MPAGLLHLLQDRTHPQAVDTPYDVAFPMEPETYAVCWRTTSGEDWYEAQLPPDACLGPDYARLARFIRDVAAAGRHTSRTVFGPGASYFSTAPSGYSWQNLPPGLEDDMYNCMKLRRPSTVALGVQGSYVVVYDDGIVTFDLRSQYPLVEALLRDGAEISRRRGVTYIALNPFVPGEYYAVYGDGSAAWNLPTDWSADVGTISRGIVPVSDAAPGGTSPAPVVQGPPAYAAQTPTAYPAAPRPPQSPPAAAPAPAAQKPKWEEGIKTAVEITKLLAVLSN